MQGKDDYMFEKENPPTRTRWLTVLPVPLLTWHTKKKKIQKLISVFAKQYSVDVQLENQIVTMIDEIIYDEKKPFDENTDLTEKEPIEKIEIIKED